MEEMIINNIDLNYDSTIKIKRYIKNKKKLNHIYEIIFVCIGTDRIIGDAFGPLVGTSLQKELEKYNISNINVYGTLENNVSYTNINKIAKLIEERYKNPYIITIDSALANKEYIGKIIVNEGKIQLGKGLSKNKIELGDLSIRAIVGKDSKMPKYNFYNLQNISLNTIMKMSDIVSNSIIEAFKN